MYLWKCKYCTCKFTEIKICVFHELLDCKENPKFEYQIQNKENESLDVLKLNLNPPFKIHFNQIKEDEHVLSK